MSIAIDEPCHENWADMTPTQKGAFCKTCAVDVIDFSNKSPEEIRETLEANAGKSMCGRFGKKQLRDLNRDYSIWRNQSAKTFQSKFLWACLIAFGMTLFTGCAKSTAKDLDLYTAQTTVLFEVDKDSVKTDTTVKHIEDIVTEPIYTDFIMGDIAYDPNWDEELPQAETEDTLKNQVVSTDTIPKKPVLTTSCDLNMVKGRIAVSPPIEPSPIITPVDTLTIPNQPEKVEIILQSNKLNAFVFPNPTTNQSTLKLRCDKVEIYTIEIFSESGQLVNQVFRGKLSPGDHRFEINLDNHNSGLYFITIRSQTEQTTLKINKVD